MTKRVLSLLLALVMALSLCVPAFAAEAPVDEAEEVGAEVVDAPAEVAVDEPAEVAVDEPVAIDYLDESVLQAAVNQANGIKDKVTAGEYQKKEGVDWPAGYTQDDAGIAKFFFDNLKEAENILAEIKDKGGYQIWYKDAKNAKRFGLLSGAVAFVDYFSRRFRGSFRYGFSGFSGFDRGLGCGFCGFRDRLRSFCCGLCGLRLGFRRFRLFGLGFVQIFIVKIVFAHCVYLQEVKENA